MKQEIKKLVKRFLVEKQKLPNVLFVSPEQLASLREELGTPPAINLSEFKLNDTTLEIVVVYEDNQ